MWGRLFVWWLVWGRRVGRGGGGLLVAGGGGWLVGWVVVVGVVVGGGTPCFGGGYPLFWGWWGVVFGFGLFGWICVSPAFPRCTGVGWLLVAG